jgi:lactose/L-arabinose transport system substrate-binding protein
MEGEALKKLLSLLFVSVLSAALFLSGCGGTKQTSSNSGGSKELTAWAWNVNVKVLKKAAADFAKTHKGFKLKIMEISNNDAY